MFNNMMINQLVLEFQFALDYPSQAFFLNHLSYHLQLLNLQDLESKTDTEEHNLISYLCHIPAYFNHANFSDCLLKILNHITEKFYRDEHDSGFDFFEHSGVVSVDLIFELLEQRRVKTAVMLLDSYQKLFLVYPELKQFFIKQVFKKLHDYSELDFVNNYGLMNLPELHFCMIKLLSLVFDRQPIIFNKKIFFPFQIMHLKMYLLFEFYMNFTEYRTNLLTSVVNRGDVHLLSRHKYFVNYMLKAYPELRQVAKTYLKQLIDSDESLYQNLAELNFIIDIFRNNSRILYPSLPEFQAILARFLGTRSIFEKLFLEHHSAGTRAALLDFYVELIKNNGFYGLSSKIHVGENILDLVTYVSHKNPGGVEFMQYLRFLNILNSQQLVPNHVLKTIIFGENTYTFNVLVRMESKSFYLMFLQFLLKKFTALQTSFTDLVEIRDYLLNSRPLLDTMVLGDPRLLSPLISFYMNYFSYTELIRMIDCYWNIIDLRSHEELVFDDGDEPELTTRIDLSFLEEDDLSHLEEGLETGDFSP